ncbi:hypothetical protein V6N13_146697 [Hibiscus sabdariffa]
MVKLLGPSFIEVGGGSQSVSSSFAACRLTAIRNLNRLVNEECQQSIAQSGQPPIHNQLVQQGNLVTIRTIKHQAIDLIEVVGVEEVAGPCSWDDELQLLITEELKDLDDLGGNI